MHVCNRACAYDVISCRVSLCSAPSCSHVYRTAVGWLLVCALAARGALAVCCGHGGAVLPTHPRSRRGVAPRSLCLDGHRLRRAHAVLVYVRDRWNAPGVHGPAVSGDDRFPGVGAGGVRTRFGAHCGALTGPGGHLAAHHRDSGWRDATGAPGLRPAHGATGCARGARGLWGAPGVCYRAVWGGARLWGAIGRVGERAGGAFRLDAVSCARRGWRRPHA